MRMRALLVSLLALSSLAAAACDSSGDDGPPPRSVFPSEDPFARQVYGRALLGAEVVSGALVQVEPSEAYGNDARLRILGDPGWTTATDPSGRYFVQNGPFLYDLSFRKDREVVVFRALGARYYEPSLGPGDAVRGFTANLAVSIDPPPADGDAVAYFVSGPSARASSGDPSALLVTFRSFDASVTLHAVEYVASGGLAAAVREGRAEVRVRAGAAASQVVPTIPVETSSEVTFVAEPPPGFALTPLDIVMDLGLRASSHPVARVAPGGRLGIAIVPGARYAVRGVATREGASSDSGRQLFDPRAPEVSLKLPPALPSEAPFDGVMLTADLTRGIVEHLLVPVTGSVDGGGAGDGAPSDVGAGGTTMRVLTGAREAPLPDVTRFGLPRPVGRYTWTSQHYPTFDSVDRFSGEDVRVWFPSSTTAPRVLELR